MDRFASRKPSDCPGKTKLLCPERAWKLREVSCLLDIIHLHLEQAGTSLCCLCWMKRAVQQLLPEHWLGCDTSLWFLWQLLQFCNYMSLTGRPPACFHISSAHVHHGQEASRQVKKQTQTFLNYRGRAMLDMSKQNHTKTSACVKRGKKHSFAVYILSKLRLWLIHYTSELQATATGIKNGTLENQPGRFPDSQNRIIGGPGLKRTKMII